MDRMEIDERVELIGGTSRLSCARFHKQNVRTRTKSENGEEREDFELGALGVRGVVGVWRSRCRVEAVGTRRSCK